MRGYEVLYIIRPDLEEEKVQEVVDKFKNLLETQGATVSNVDKWGKRRLAYEVKDRREGIYVQMNFKAESGVSAELERVLRITDDVIRYLIVKEGEE